MKKSKRSKKSNSWKIKQHKDPFFKKSKILGYRSRAAFKLIELNKKFKFLKTNTKLLDLGSYPGGWSQVASKIVTNGKILSVDIKNMNPIKNVNFYKSDIFQQTTKSKIKDFFDGKLEVIISDMAADTTGNKSLDSIRTNQLCFEILNLSHKILVPNGVFVSKVFMGEDFDEIKKSSKTLFKEVKFFKPISSRNESRETYIHCRILKTL
ncbi:RlmE family RNA methyltransferase [Candidatus Pelagibacter bacterium]|nr:RlmE family RNA methyltransferase [Candidatus Pelagibacter bacterium]